jgi:hypothetical protein
MASHTSATQAVYGLPISLLEPEALHIQKAWVHII